MKIKIGGTTFSPVPDGLTIVSPQKIAEIQLPDIQNVFQDFGPGPKRFTVTGVFEKKDGGLSQALALDEVKRKGEEVIFAIDKDFSWKVRIENFNFNLLPMGHVRYSAEMVEVSEPKPFVFTPQPELKGPDKMDMYVALLRVKAKGFSLLWKLEGALAKVKEIIRGIRRLSELPYDQLNLLKFELGVIGLQCAAIKAEAKRILDSPQRNYSALEEMLKWVYQYVQLIEGESEFLLTAANAVPKGEQTYVVKGDDTLMAISLAYYKTAGRWTDIAAANKIIDPTTIQAGQELLIPE